MNIENFDIKKIAEFISVKFGEICGWFGLILILGSALIVCFTIGGSQPCSAWCTEASTMDRFFWFAFGFA